MGLKDISGLVYGKLTVIERSLPNVGGNAMWRCKCECGKEKNIAGCSLRSGLTTSCGCTNLKIIKQRSTTHSMRNTRQYACWHNMKQRCQNPNNHKYCRYGGRGITYDPKWETFEGFWEDMQDGYRADLQIDRIDNDGNYCKENCKWSTRREQMNNTSRSVFIEHNGIAKTVSEWAEYLNVDDKKLRKRIENGWTIDKILMY